MTPTKANAPYERTDKKEKDGRKGRKDGRNGRTEGRKKRKERKDGRKGEKEHYKTPSKRSGDASGAALGRKTTRIHA